MAEKTTTESITNKPGLINRRRVEPFVIGEESIAAGTRKIVHVPVANLYSHDQPLTLPVHVLHGRRPGPVLFISAAIHGDELNGVEILHRLLLHRALRRLRGTLLAVSVVNGFGMLHQSRYLPDRRDLNRSFPGSSGGSLGARLAHIFLKEIVDRSQIGIDLHTAASSRNNLPHVRANLDDEETRALADAFGVPVVIHSAARDGSLREVAAERGVKMLLFEAGEALRFNEAAVRIGLLGILRLMRSVGMLPAGRRPPRVREPYVARSSSWVRAPSTGMVNLATRLGDRVERGAVLARIFDPYDLFSDADLVRSSYEGVIIGINNNPLTHEGDALVHIARYAQAGDVAEELEAMHQDLLGGTLEPWR